MARKMITRTFTRTMVNFLGVNTETETVDKFDYCLNESFRNKDGNFDVKAIIKALTKAIALDEDFYDITFVKLNKVVEIEELYGMEEEKFLSFAERLPSRNNKD